MELFKPSEPMVALIVTDPNGKEIHDDPDQQ